MNLEKKIVRRDAHSLVEKLDLVGIQRRPKEDSKMTPFIWDRFDGLDNRKEFRFGEVSF